MRGRAPQPSQERPMGGGWGARGGKWPEEKIAIGLDTLRNFNVRAKIVGPGGIFVKYIQAETVSAGEAAACCEWLLTNDVLFPYARAGHPRPNQRERLRVHRDRYRP